MNPLKNGEHVWGATKSTSGTNGPSDGLIFLDPPREETGCQPKNRDFTPPKWMVYNGKPFEDGWFGGFHPYFWKHQCIFTWMFKTTQSTMNLLWRRLVCFCFHMSIRQSPWYPSLWSGIPHPTCHSSFLRMCCCSLWFLRWFLQFLFRFLSFPWQKIIRLNEFEWVFAENGVQG